MPAYATLADVETCFGPIPEQDVGKVEALLVQAEALVGQTVPDVAGRIASGRTSPTLVALVLAEMVTAVLRNPDGVRQRSETVGPFSRATTFGGTATAGIVDPDLGVLAVSRRQRRMLGDRRGAVTVPATDPALPRPMVRPGDGIDRSAAFSRPVP